MTISDYENTNDEPVDKQGFLAPTSMKDFFYKWLEENNIKFRSENVVAMLDRSSALLIKCKLSTVSIWEITSAEEFDVVRNKAIEHKVFLVLTGRKAIKFFNQCCGFLYSFLKTNIPNALMAESNNEVFQEQSNDTMVTAEKKKINEDAISDSPIIGKAVDLIKKKFGNGYRVSSGIDFERFKNYYAIEFKENFTHSADWLAYCLSSVSIIFDDRYYIYNDEAVENVRTMLKQANSLCININIFFEIHSSELYSIGIFSADMLKAFVVNKYESVSCKWDYIYLSKDTSPAEIIRSVFDERETWSCDELNERLPYIKMDTVKQTLNRDDYFRIDAGIYTHIDNMDLPEEEGAKVEKFIIERLNIQTYVNANELDLSKFEKLNLHCSYLAIRDAVYYKFLSQNYDKSGQIITRKGEKLRVLDILEKYCLDAETVSFDELNRLEASLDPDGRTHSLCLIAAHNTLVRVSEALFVAEKKVAFDVEKIDDILTLYCQDNFIPLKSITDFSLFPYAGYSWNLFLLESYVRKYSRLFKFDVRAVNSANIGVIVKKSFDYEGYDALLAAALAQTEISLSDKTAVGEFLFNNGYIGWRNLGKNEAKIFAKAKELRERGAN